VIIASTNAFSQNRQLNEKYTETQLQTKFERLNAAMDRVAKLKKRGYMPKAIEGAREAVAIAENEFEETNIIVVKPLFALVELLGKQRRYEEAERTLEKIYTIIGSGEEDTTTIYAIGYRMWIAKLYIKWNKFDEAESTLMAAQKIIKNAEWKAFQKPAIYTHTDSSFAGFKRSINTELEKVHALQEVNRFNIKKKKKDLRLQSGN